MLLQKRERPLPRIPGVLGVVRTRHARVIETRTTVGVLVDLEPLTESAERGLDRSLFGAGVAPDRGHDQDWRLEPTDVVEDDAADPRIAGGSGIRGRSLSGETQEPEIIFPVIDRTRSRAVQLHE